MSARRLLFTMLWPLLSLMLATGCSADSDADDVRETIVGNWQMDHYTVEAERNPGLEVVIDHIILKADSTFEVYYRYDEEEECEFGFGGNYEAGADYLRFEYYDETGTFRRWLCQIVDYSPGQMVLTYTDDNYSVRVRVWLNRLYAGT